MRPIAILRKFFHSKAHPLTTKELKDLSVEERHELAKLAAVELGVEFTLD